jgi:outer membrane immunogenic protein
MAAALSPAARSAAIIRMARWCSASRARRGRVSPTPCIFTSLGDTQNIFTRNRWSADVAVRAGLAFDRALVYGKAGIAQGRFAFSEADIHGPFASGASTLTGVLLGVGLEYGFAPNWSAKLEYDHIEYADRTVHFDQSVFPGPFNVTEAASANLIKVGINYRFGGPGSAPMPDGATAHAAIYKALPAKAPAAAAFSWTGCYAGVHAGGGWMRDTFVGGAFNGGGGFAGGQLGCNLQAGAIVWGIEGEAAWSGLTDHFHIDQAGTSFSDTTTRNRWSADVAARAGIAVDRTLIYGKVGIAAGGFAFSFTQTVPAAAAQDGSATLAGLLLGAGVEYALTQNWSVKLEYDHVDYFGRIVGFDSPFLGHNPGTDAATTDVLKLGVNYRFAQGTSGDLPFALAADRTASAAAILKAPVYKAPAAANYWTRCYAGVHGGGGLLGDSFPIGGADVNPISESSGGFAGGQLGCDLQTGALVWGLEGEAAWSHIVNRAASSIPAQKVSQERSSDLVWGGDVAARAGVAIDRGLLYGKAGLAVGRFGFEFSNTSNITVLSFFEHGSTTLTGLLLGGGIEYALAPNWSVLLEYDRIAYTNGVVHFDAVGRNPFNQSEAATVNEAKAGINYRFGGTPLPPTASASQPLLPPPVTDWTGCYAGVHAGGGIIEDTFVPPGSGVGTRGGGAIAGGQAGCNVQTGIMVFGLGGDAAWSNLTNHSSFNGLTMQQASDRHRWSADLAARTGIAFDRALLYGKAGVAAGRFDFFDVDNTAQIITGGILQGGATLTGLLLGLGVEYAFAPNWSAKLEYDHVGYLSRNIDLGANGSNNQSVTTNTVKAGVNYKFFGPSAVVVAKD